MKYVLIGVGAYVALLFLKGQATNAAVASCGGVGAPGTLNCAALKAAQVKWSWLPEPLGGL